jgi:signal transduction histidine kinase
MAFRPTETSDIAPILVVDDQPMNLDAIDALLTQSDCRIVRAQSADQALLALLEQDFAAIVLDIKMPGMGGIELADLIKTRHRSRHTPILFLTAHMFNEREVLRGYGAGAVDYLTKPVHADILRSKIAVFVELFRKSRELARANDALRREVHGRLRVEEALRIANQELEGRVLDRTNALQRADRRKDEFLAVLGHELRNPLAPILSAVEVLETGGVTAEFQGQARNVLRRQVRQMTRLIDDLLDVGRITSDRLVLQVSTVDLASVVAAAVETTRSAIEDRKQRLTVTLPHEPLLLHVDAARLSQVLSNLLSNATKYTQSGGEIWLRAEATDAGLAIHVRDSGVGIDPAVLPTIFDLFVQAEDHGRSAAGGLGVGLTLARRLAEIHGGRLEAQSAGRGLGSEFSLWLPPAVFVTPPDPVVPDPVAETASRHRRVLIVDDNDDAADMLSLMFGSWGHHARTAYDAETAIDVARDFRPEIVLLDLGLPGIDGYQVAQSLLAEPWAHALVLFAVTGRGQEEDRRRTSETGFREHFVKPVSPDSLRQAIDALP